MAVQARTWTSVHRDAGEIEAVERTERPIVRRRRVHAPGAYYISTSDRGDACLLAIGLMLDAGRVTLAGSSFVSSDGSEADAALAELERCIAAGDVVRGERAFKAAVGPSR